MATPNESMGDGPPNKKPRYTDEGKSSMYACYNLDITELQTIRTTYEFRTFMHIAFCHS